jgi:hypothetical protein
MAKRKKPLVPRLGPPVNLRPAGVHDDARRPTRSEMKAALRKEQAALDFIQA